MDVYAEYFIETDKKEYRRKTLLHFGESTKLIGSAVLMNPGSAKPIGDSNIEIIKSFYAENHGIDNINTDNWKKFHPDSTMRQLEKIFIGWYVGKDIKLNGVIQLFNCFYFRNQNYEEAIKDYNQDSIYNFNEYQFFGNEPVYFGWGAAGRVGELKPIATKIFSKYEVNKTPIYDSTFENNCFYHPGYVNRSYKKNINTQKLVKDFANLMD